MTLLLCSITFLLARPRNSFSFHIAFKSLEFAILFPLSLRGFPRPAFIFTFYSTTELVNNSYKSFESTSGHFYLLCYT